MGSSPVLPLPSRVVSGRFLDSSTPQFLLLFLGTSNSVHFTEIICGLNESACEELSTVPGAEIYTL